MEYIECFLSMRYEKTNFYMKSIFKGVNIFLHNDKNTFLITHEERCIFTNIIHCIPEISIDKKKIYINVIDIDQNEKLYLMQFSFGYIFHVYLSLYSSFIKTHVFYCNIILLSKTYVCLLICYINMFADMFVNFLAKIFDAFTENLICKKYFF